MPIDDTQEQLEQKLSEKAAEAAGLQSNIDALEIASFDAIAKFDADGIITGWNAQAQQLFGWSAEEIIGQPFEHTLITGHSPDNNEGFIGMLPHSDQDNPGSRLFNFDGLNRDGHEIPIQVSIALITNSMPETYYACIRDVSERELAESVIWNQANFDELTCLPNRNLFIHELEQSMLENRRNETSMALLNIDLDRFKEINDGFGHNMGDLLLIEISSRLKNTVREVDTVSRLSGDQFTVILGNISEELAVQRICQDIVDSLAKPFPLDNEMAHLTASIGVTFFPQDAEDIDLLQKNAEQAMFAAKTAGRNRFHFFTSELQQQAQRKRNIINQLRNAIKENQFEVYYQPIIDMSSGELHKAEALLRWHHPEKELVSPAVFIPLAEESGLIHSIGDWVFQQTIEQVEHWHQQFDAKIQVSINTSPLQWINEGSAMREWFPRLAELKSRCLSITVEITEGLMLDSNEAIINRILEFHDVDVQIAIDDFGTGYSSVSDLKQFEIDYLKIDQSIVRNMDSDANDRDSCEAIIVMAHKLGIQVIAEGVETETQRQLLQEFNCDYAQGFLFSKPVPAGEFERLLGSAAFPT